MNLEQEIDSYVSFIRNLSSGTMDEHTRGKMWIIFIYNYADLKLFDKVKDLMIDFPKNYLENHFIDDMHDAVKSLNRGCRRKQSNLEYKKDMDDGEFFICAQGCLQALYKYDAPGFDEIFDKLKEEEFKVNINPPKLGLVDDE